MTAVQPSPFCLNPALDAQALARDFSLNRRLQIRDFMTPSSAQALKQALHDERRWLHVINGEAKVFEIDSDQFAALPAAERDLLDKAVIAAAGRGFQFQYDTIRVADGLHARQESGTMLDAFADFMGSGETLRLLASICGDPDIVFADAQATRYNPGDFLTMHDDNVAGKGRRCAYVLGLTDDWRAEWGGLLMFHDKSGGIADVFTPGFNTLNIFALPQPHSVSHVAPFAMKPRVSVTGWLRAQPQPA